MAALNTHKTKCEGRQMILAQSTWGGAVIKSSADSTGLEILTATMIRAATTDIQLLGTYWPIPHKADEHTQSLTNPISAAIHQEKRRKSQRQLTWLDKRYHQNRGVKAPGHSVKHLYPARRLQCEVVSGPGKRRNKSSYTIMDDNTWLEEYNRRTTTQPSHHICNEI